MPHGLTTDEANQPKSLCEIEQSIAVSLSKAYHCLIIRN